MYFLDDEKLTDQSGRLRFGCHDFINALPITWPLVEGLVGREFDLLFAPPAELAEKLRLGLLDAAFIPSIEYARIDGLKVVPGFCIAARGEVRTVTVYSTKRIEEVRTIAADRRSRTSVALLKVLFEEYYKRQVRIVLDAAQGAEQADAHLLIGDEAFGIDREAHHVYDLSEAWHEMTQKSFVFALLCVRRGVDADAAIATLHKAKAEGLRRIDDICKKTSAGRGITEEVCRDYLTARIRYDLDSDDLDGLRLFYGYAAKYGVIEQAPDIDFYG